MNGASNPLDGTDTTDKDNEIIDRESIVNSDSNGDVNKSRVEQASPLVNTEKKVKDTCNDDENKILNVDAIDDTEMESEDFTDNVEMFGYNLS